MTCYIFDLHVYRGATVQTMVSLKFNMLFVVILINVLYIHLTREMYIRLDVHFFLFIFFVCTLYVTKCTNHSNINDCIDVH